MLLKRRIRLTSSGDTVVNPKCSPRSSLAESLDQRELEDHYTIERELGSGTYGRVVLARCHATHSEVALKILPKSVKLRDVIREFNYSYYLSPHSNVVSTFDVAFETSTAYVFAQEHAPLGDLFEAITPRAGLPEKQAKIVATQIASALEFMHSRSLVHRDVKPENVLVFDEELTRIKLMDFGMTKRVGTAVRKVSRGIPYTPPEICRASRGDQYSVETGHDVWAFGVLLFCALTGNFPWELAYGGDIYYSEFSAWHHRSSSKLISSSKQPPPQWRRFTPRLMRLFRRLLDPKPDKRCEVNELHKFITDDWMLSTQDMKSLKGVDAISPTDPVPVIVLPRERRMVPDETSDMDPASSSSFSDMKSNPFLKSERTTEISIHSM